MKKYVALILAAVVLTGVLSSCTKPVKGGTLVTDSAGNGYAAITKPDGNVKRDEAGNLVVLVTDANGRGVKDESGENKTNVVAIDHALVVGRRIECTHFAMNIPDGWNNNASYSDLIVKREDSEDQIVVSFFEDTTLAEKKTERLKLYESIKETYSSGRYTESETEICGQPASLHEAYVVPADAAPVYVAYYFFEYGGIVYSCFVSSNRDLTGNTEIAGIINTLEFI